MEIKMSKLYVPKLRFGEFDGEWVEKRLGDYGKLVKGLTYSPDNIQSTGLLVLRSSNIQNNQLSLLDNVYVNLEVDEELLIKEDDILICVRNGSKRLIGKNIIIPKNLEKSTHGAFMTVFRGNANKFISHWFQTTNYYKEVHKNLGATINSINGSDLKKFKTILPQKPEQQKIATFLTAVDQKIEKLTKKEKLLVDYKKGVMQKIFSQELRFMGDDGEVFGDWVEKPLFENFKEVLDFRGRTPLKLNMDWGGGNIISLSANNVKDGYIDFNAECNLGSKKLYEKWMGKVNLEKNDIVFTMEAPLGKALLIPDNREYILSQRVVAFKTNKNINNKFLIQLIWSNKFQNEIIKLSTGSTAKGINQKSLKRIKVNIPSLKEQTKIANFLSSIDKKIEQVKSQIDESKRFKKGLLQQMFV